MSAQTTGATFKVGDLLNNTYRIEAVLGRGGTSEVYQARSEISGNRVALKVLRAEFSRNEDFLNLMTREEDIREIRHDAIVRYYHNQRNENNDVFLVMDFVDGPGLDKKMKQGGMSAADLMIVAERVLQGLKAAHSKLIVHRDLSPDNIILRNGNPAEAVIIDFGIAKDSNPGAGTIVGNEFAGKYAYAAPEQLSGHSDARSDLYALGALLLATFRGKAPDVGNNPIEVIEKKGLPLDTSGVPEPLKTLIDRMTTPDPQLRPPDANAVLDLIHSADDTAAAPTPLGDATVIAPRPATAPPATAPTTNKPAKAPREVPEKKSGSGGKLTILALLTVAVLGAGAYFGGLFDPLLSPGLPVADPYTLTIERTSAGQVTAVGNVPSTETETALSQRVADLGGDAQLTLAQGAISENWGTGILGVLDTVQTLPEWSVEVSGDSVRVEGLTEDRDDYDRMPAALEQTAAPAGLSLQSAIELGPRILLPSALAPILKAYADCGSLWLLNTPPLGYTNADSVVVGGRLSTEEVRENLKTALKNAAGQRSVEVSAQVLNPTLCLFDDVLPNVPSGGFEITFALGETGEPVPFGDYTVGQNPVIDLVIPADITTGYLFASALDVSGNVFHLLPNMNRPDNSVEALRDGQTGDVTIRLAHTLEEAAASNGKKLAFVVDDTALGKTQILVIHAQDQFLDGMRPTTESAMSYAVALVEKRDLVDSLDTRILTTTQP